jgi:superfamily I DNA and/or RNA helicase
LEEGFVNFKPIAVHLPLPSIANDADKSQREAISMALSQRLSLIQGPPGTGKTFVGMNIIRSLLLQSSNSKILILSYTHHALDNLLENLISQDTSLENDIVRFGNPSKVSENLKKCCPQQVESVNPFSYFDRLNKIDLREQIAGLNSEVTNAVNSILSQPAITSNSWKMLQPVLSNEQKLQFDNSEDNFKKWMNNKLRPKTLTVENPFLWDLDQKERDVMKRKWWTQLVKLDELLAKVCELNHLRNELSCLTKLYEIDSGLKSKRILACTTSFAIINRDVIDSCGPTIMFVEEAGEIHESHILTNLSLQIQQLVMIGDHKQLKPKLENYKLRAESNYGIDFDVSLFERLVKKGYPVAVLNVQHRMIPEISQFIRQQTYPELIDADTVKNRKAIRGSPSNIRFIHHSESEGQLDVSSSIGLSDNSKINEFEVKLSLKLVEYFLEQGYKADEIVILTPYLGQVVYIRNFMKESSTLQTKLNPMDCAELMIFDDDICYLPEEFYDFPAMKESSCKKNGNQRKNSIRVSTIDNFQGEQSRIIIVSLVRSNVHGNIGFMKIPERVNVLMSRARDGLFIIGNATTYCHCKNLWFPIVQTFMKQNAITRFPAGCDLKSITVPDLLYNTDKLELLKHAKGEICEISKSLKAASSSVCFLGEDSIGDLISHVSDDTANIRQVFLSLFMNVTLLLFL